MKINEILSEKTLYHGSPHKFRKFDHSQMGTGEGAQAYGWGTYLAQNPDVAKSYTPRDYDAETAMLNRYKQAEARRDYTEMEMWENAMLHETPDEIVARYASSDYDDATRAVAQRVSNDLRDMMGDVSNLYEVDLPDEAIAKMLDWDAPLSDEFFRVISPKQAGKIVKDWEKATGNTWDFGNFYQQNGNELYSALADAYGQEGASAYLRELGIPGIRYLDSTSRSAGKGTHNFVVFDERLITIISRNEIPL